ncbi:hypothetical protein LCL97_13485 [Seohaeicola saemankumensis]|nr:hypothetical protein [Seohaeicola saemankumensis]MCA0871845.1 hypothetical protein [Seohaeicola saemankumensis]
MDNFVFKKPGAIVENHLKVPDIDGESQLDVYAIWGTNGTAIHVNVRPPVEWMHIDPVIPGDGPAAVVTFEDPLFG